MRSSQGRRVRTSHQVQVEPEEGLQQGTSSPSQSCGATPRGCQSTSFLPTEVGRLLSPLTPPAVQPTSVPRLTMALGWVRHFSALNSQSSSHFSKSELGRPYRWYDLKACTLKQKQRLDSHVGEWLAKFMQCGQSSRGRNPGLTSTPGLSPVRMQLELHLGSSARKPGREGAGVGLTPWAQETWSVGPVSPTRAPWYRQRIPRHAWLQDEWSALSITPVCERKTVL